MSVLAVNIKADESGTRTRTGNRKVSNLTKIYLGFIHRGWFHKAGSRRLVPEGWFKRLVPEAGSRGWFQRLVPEAGSRGWFQGLVPEVGSRG